MTLVLVPNPMMSFIHNNDNPELSDKEGSYMTSHCLMSTLVPSIGHLSPYKSIWPSIICCWCCPATAVGVVGAIQFREQDSSGQGLFFSTKPIVGWSPFNWINDHCPIPWTSRAYSTRPTTSPTTSAVSVCIWMPASTYRSQLTRDEIAVDFIGFSGRWMTGQKV